MLASSKYSSTHFFHVSRNMPANNVSVISTALYCESLPELVSHRMYKLADSSIPHHLTSALLITLALFVMSLLKVLQQKVQYF